ncbi:unnamed protein product [Diplocarpon coronariae]
MAASEPDSAAQMRSVRFVAHRTPHAGEWVGPRDQSLCLSQAGSCARSISTRREHMTRGYDSPTPSRVCPASEESSASRRRVGTGRPAG